MGRHLDERLALRAPRLCRWLAKLVLMLPPGSPVRRRAVKRAVARAWAALSRGDDEIIYRLVFDRDIEFNIIGGAAGGPPPGLDKRYQGHEGWREFIGLWRAEWGGGHIEHTPAALIDLGDRFVMRVTLAARGAASVADVGMNMGVVSWLADGAIVRQDNYYQWPACVEALGLDHVASAVAAPAERQTAPRSAGSG